MKMKSFNGKLLRGREGGNRRGSSHSTGSSSAPPRCSGVEGAGMAGSGQQAAGFYLMKVVFPVEYCPTSSTMGLLSKSASSRAGEWNSWNL